MEKLEKIKRGIFPIDKYINYIKSVDFPDNLKKYYISIFKRIDQEVSLSLLARSKRIDPAEKPEPIFTWDMAERVEMMFNVKGLSEFIRKNSRNTSREKLAILVIDAFIRGEFGIYPIHELVDKTIRVSLAILTEGMTVAPIEGIKKIVLKDSPRGRYISIYFAGPIRAAGGTEAGLVLVYADYVRKCLGLSRYFPKEEDGNNEILRFIEELRIYEKHVARFQYKVTDEAVIHVLRNIPIEINGVATDDVEVLVNRDLERVETNKVRGGALRVLNDGIIGRARKIHKIVEELGIDGWEWLKDLYEKKEVSPVNGDDLQGDDTDVISHVIIGRPVISVRNCDASLRIRYGRLSNMGLSAVAIHPAVFPLLNYFIVIGSQLKLNLPGKGGIVVPSNICSPPIVLLDNGSVVRLETEDDARKYSKRIKKILFLGDIMISFGDFLENNFDLVPSPYTEEWWYQDLLDALSKSKGISKFNILSPYDTINFYNAYLISKTLNIPLHPRYIYRWNRLKVDEIIYLIKKIGELGEINEENNLIIKYDEVIKSYLEKLLFPHKIRGKTIIIDDKNDVNLWILLISNYFLDEENILKYANKVNQPLDFVGKLMGVKLVDVEGEKIDARLGRPEKVKPRETSPPINVLFPVSKYGGSKRDLIKASEIQRYIIVSLAIRYCNKCKTYTYKIFCPNCRNKTIQKRYCTSCKYVVDNERCPQCGRETIYTKPFTLDIKTLINDLAKKLRVNVPKELKGVEGLLNKYAISEDLGKGIIRAINNIYIFKDGTSRIDITNAPLHQFRVKDIGITVSEARFLGYNVKDEDEILDLYPQDIIIPYAAAKYLINIANYIDELLEKVYGLKPYYNIKKYKDLLGHLVIGLSPHTSVGIIGRIIGFTSSSVLYAHPLWHAAKRRDCDGDEDSIILLMDVLLNFSVSYLPSSPGGKMDTPIYISPIIHPEEVDTQVFNIDSMSCYPQKFYLSTLKRASPKKLIEEGAIKTYINDFKRNRNYYKFESFGYPFCLELKENVSIYSKLSSMRKKLDEQIIVMKKVFNEEIVSNIIASIINNHILPDILGNLRAFSSQIYKCMRCRRNIRRPLLSGNCPICGGPLSQTVHPRSITKYLDIGKELLRYVKHDHYLYNRFNLLEKELLLTLKDIEVRRVKITDFI